MVPRRAACHGRQRRHDEDEKDPMPSLAQPDETRKRCCPLENGGGEDSSSWDPSSTDADYGSNVDTAQSSNEISSRSNDVLVTSHTVASVKEDVQEDLSDVEVLLVIQPPTPKRPKRRDDKNLPPSELREGAEARATSVVTPYAPSAVVPPFASNESSRKDSDKASSAAEMNTGGPKYSYQSSAYVQNLAEICHTILWDRRWRVGEDASRIFAWERGDNLSAVHSLSRLYQEDRPKVKHREKSAACLLCRKVEKTAPDNDESTSEKGRVAGKEDILADSVSEVNDSTTNNAPATSDDNPTLMDEDEARALHLYCRLFYRKGPWFRLDDLYARYYAPKGTVRSSKSASGDATVSSKTDTENEEARVKDPPDDTNGTKRSTFFLPKQPTMPKNGQRRGQMTGKGLHEYAIHGQLGAVSQLCHDICRLHSMGLIRSFFHEEECGKTVGAVKDEGTGVILTAEERRYVLSRLGGASSKTKRYPSFSTTDTAEEPRQKQRRRMSQQNHVWKQMCRQHSIVGQIQGNSQNKSLLPVRRHVDALLLDKLATKVVLSSKPGHTFPASILREHVATMKDAICQILRGMSKVGTDSTVADCNMCIRLNENPLRTLRRFARLYLCASNGPGNMRGDGTNGWMSLRDPSETGFSHSDLPLSNYVQPPGSHLWHSISYPSLLHRFGVRTCVFTGAYQSHLATNDLIEKPKCVPQGKCDAGGSRHSSTKMERVFSSVGDFHAWELCTEIRANIDYLIEVNELMRYHERRKAKETSAGTPTVDGSADHVVDAEDSCSSLSPDSQGIKELVPPTEPIPADFLDVLTTSGRAKILQKLLSLSYDSESPSGTVDTELIHQVHKEVEEEVLSLFVTQVEISDTSVNPKCRNGCSAVKKAEISLHATVQSSAAIGRFESDFESLIGVISIVAVHVLIARHKLVSQEELSLMVTRPWLRHMWWDGNLAYVLWDCVPFLERRGYYVLATKALEVLLFGFPQEHEWKAKGKKATVLASSCRNMESTWPPPPSSLSTLLMSRRARGKAYERLIIDYTHMLRIRAREITYSELGNVKSEQATLKKRTRKKSDVSKDAQLKVNPQDTVARLCDETLKSVVTSGSIPFSAQRSLARKVKRPLAELLRGNWCMEALELGLRLEDCTLDEQQQKKPLSRGYQDWTPVTDQAVANAIEGESSTVGSRCSFVGFEDDGLEAVAPSSLNVEELAMEFYASGRLPVDQAEPRGGWLGWHDEGGHVRALFRIICSSVLLDVDGGCGNHPGSTIEKLENPTIFLTPYQSAPFDLHVGHARTATHNAQDLDGTAQTQDCENTFVRGFYQRHRDRIDQFLSKLEVLDNQELCDVVFDSIVDRLKVLPKKATDASLQRDLQQVRTFSMLAAGFGGPMLSAMFRCLLFDYRHYSGGLPDLLLVRALRGQKASNDSESDGQDQLIDLGEWVGEGFSAQSKEEQEMARRASLLVDRDDEFLGCSKMGDTAGQSAGRWRGGGQQRPFRQKEGVQQEDSNAYTIEKLPPRLCLVHNGVNVKVECMFVEVKSSNDRLDPRQEDWLNVLDSVGNARVCKFGNGKKKNGKRP